MKVSGINGPAQSITLRNQSKQDNYEKNIQKQIATLQEKMRNIENDKEVPIERKINAKKEIQEQIQELQSELQQYQMQKRQKEAAERQEAVKQASMNNYQTGQSAETKAGISQAETGVIISLSSTKEQIAGMKKIKTDLEGKLRIAKTAEEREDLQGKIDKLNENIGRKIKESQDTMEQYQKTDTEKIHNDKHNKSESLRGEDNDEEIEDAAAAKYTSVADKENKRVGGLLNDRT